MNLVDEMASMPVDLRIFSLDELLTQLHDAIASFVKTIDSTIDRNKGINKEDVVQLREHIKGRLSRKEYIKENEKLLRLIDLFETNKATMKFIKEDAKEWLEFIYVLESSIKSKKIELTDEEKEELEEIHEKLEGLTLTLRSEQTES